MADSEENTNTDTVEEQANGHVADESGVADDENNTSTLETVAADNAQFVDDDGNVQPDAIDLVLQEIGEQTEATANGSKATKLQFKDVDLDANPEVTPAEQNPGCSDPVFRYKVLDTLFLFWNTTTMGWVYGQMGPALPDLQILAGVPLQQATWLFTGFAIGYLAGCLLAGIIQDKFNSRLMLFLYTFGTALTIGVLPWIPVFVVMVVIRFLNGICIGGQDTGLHSMLFAIWAKEGGPFIQMTHCLSALGGILAPLVTQPFVSQSTDLAEKPGPMYTTVAMNNSVTTYNHSFASASFSTHGLTSLSTSPPAKVETKIQYAFLITGLLVLSAAIPFLVAFLSKRKIKKAARQYSNESVDRNKLPKKIKVLILCIIFTNSFIATAYIDLFPSFLVTFIMEQNQWTQKAASSLTSLYFGTYGVGNFIGVFILAYVTSTKLIVFSYISSGIVLLGILLSVLHTQTILVWVTVALSGITMSAILPTLFTWTQENVTPITGRLASGLLISGSAGVMVNPLLLGYMIEMYSPLWFLYLSLGETVFCGLLFTTALTLSRIYSSKDKPESSKLNKPESPVKDMESVDTVDQVKIYPRGTLYGI